MRHLLSSCVIAFSTYSRIPMPQVDWNEKNMKHTLAFFPLVGAAVGAAFWGADALCRLLDLGDVLRAALLTAVPAVVTGGIHLDGYCDTVDALASHAPREKKLAILKDSSAGAFAVIWCCVWFLLYFALLTELERLWLAFPTAQAEYLTEYRRRCGLIGRAVNFRRQGKMVQGEALAVNDDFSLQVRLPGGGETALTAGEVSVRL